MVLEFEYQVVLNFVYANNKKVELVVKRAGVGGQEIRRTPQK